MIPYLPTAGNAVAERSDVVWMIKNFLSKYKWYRKRKGGTWYYVVAYYEFQYWINREPLGNEKIRIKEMY